MKSASHDSFRSATELPDRDDDRAASEMGWVIERHIDSELRYWAGRGPDDWRLDHNEAVRFARRADAELMLTYHGKGIGRVVEHMWARK